MLNSIKYIGEIFQSLIVCGKKLPWYADVAEQSCVKDGTVILAGNAIKSL